MSEERPGFSILICPDPQLTREKLESLAREYAPRGGELKKFLFWGDEPPNDRFWEALSQRGLFAEDKLVITRKAHEWGASVWKEISRQLASPRERVLPVFCLEGEWDKGKAKIPAYILKTGCMSFAEKKKWVWTQPPLNDINLRAYASKTARALGLNVSSALLEKFCASITPDAGQAKNALEKLSLVAGDQPVTQDMISENCANPESDAFACLRRIENGDLKGAWSEIAGDDKGASLFFLISLLARELRQIWSLRAGETPWVRPAENSFKRRLAKNLDFRALSDGFAALAEAEFSVKSGKAPPERALEILSVRMTRLFSLRKNC